MALFYILDENKNAIPTDDILAVGAEVDDADGRRVDKTEIGQYLVSTVFLGINHNLDSNGPPLIFETMIFDENGHTVDQGRTSTWQDAEYMHRRVCEELSKRQTSVGWVGKFLNDM